MHQVFSYTDYRRFLLDWYTGQKQRNRHISHRYIGEKLSLKSSGHFSLILKGRAGISSELALRFARLLKLSKRETDYFECLVQYNQAKSFSQKRHWFEKLTRFNESTVRTFDSSMFEYYDRWYYAVIHRVLDFYPFSGDFTALARMVDPPIATRQARRAVEVLQKLGMVRIDGQGRYVSTEPLVSTGYDADSVAITSYIRGSLDRAKEAMERVAREKRNFSTVTFSVSEQTFAALQEEIRAFRRRLMGIVKADESPRRVYQFNMQIFPVSKETDE
jgi:uncharacterized protein (TIGR02147 family)